MLNILINGAIERHRKKFEALVSFCQKADKTIKDDRSAECKKRPYVGLTREVTTSAVMIRQRYDMKVFSSNVDFIPEVVQLSIIVNFDKVQLSLVCTIDSQVSFFRPLFRE